MSNSTNDYWAVDGFSLQTYAWNIQSWGGNLHSPPPMRGENLTLPTRAGAKWKAKQPDSRLVTLAMHVIGADVEGVVPADSRLTFQTNYANLRQLLWDPYRQMALSKRYLNGTITATGSAQFAGGLELEMHGTAGAAFTVDLLMADPFFYSTTTNLFITPRPVGTHAIVTQGHAATPRYTLYLTGPLTNPSITVKSGSTVLSYCSYTGTIATGETLNVTFPDFVVTGSNGNSSPANMVTSQMPWVILSPSATSVVVGGSGAGEVAISYYPAWF